VRVDVEEPHLTAWRSLLNAHATLVGKIEQALVDASLPPLAWYDVLWAIRRAPERRVRMAELADSLTISRGGLTKLFDRLESAGLVGREPAADDGRSVFAVITPEGSRMRPGGRSDPGAPQYRRLTVTLLRCVKLSSMPSRENSRPIPLCLNPP